MDTYDVFKKLTRGAKFKKQLQKSDLVKVRNTFSTEITSKPMAIEKEIKQELVESNDSKGEEEELVLLGSMIAKSDGNPRKRKKKVECDNENKRRMLEQEKINHFRNVNQIKTIGSHIPDPIANFEQLQIDEDLVKNLVKCGYCQPTAIQKQAISVMLNNRNVLACAPTGSGKTAAFSIPLIQMLSKQQHLPGIKALIICPTRELAKQTQREFLRLADGRSIKIAIINKIFNADKSTYLQKCDVLITTPNRLCFLLTEEKPLVSLKNVQWLIVDEADKLFEEGANSFRKQLQQILNLLDLKVSKVGMFSATHTPVVAKWCRKQLKGLIRITIGQRNAATDSVEQELLFVGNEAGKLIAFRDVVRKGLMPPVLVFVQSKERAQQLFTELIYDGINVAVIHSDQTQLQRDNTVKCFREGNIWVLICTDLMARGVDFKGVNLVINYDFPSSAISYVHRIGRAGRAGKTGKAITYFTVNDTVNLKSIAHILKQSGCHVPDYMLALKRRSKTEKKKLANAAPKRDDIAVRLSKRKHK